MKNLNYSIAGVIFFTAVAVQGFFAVGNRIINAVALIYILLMFLRDWPSDLVVLSGLVVLAELPFVIYLVSFDSGTVLGHFAFYLLVAGVLKRLADEKGN